MESLYHGITLCCFEKSLLEAEFHVALMTRMNRGYITRCCRMIRGVLGVPGITAAEQGGVLSWKIILLCTLVYIGGQTILAMGVQHNE